MSTLSATEVINEITTKAPASPEKRVVPTMKVGQGIRQGDLYIIKINDTKSTKIRDITIDPKTYTVLSKLPGGQLVDGYTQGSRHCVDPKQVEILTTVALSNNPLIGPILKSKERFDVTHPEHAHFSLPEGTYQVFYQLNPKTMQRVKD